MRGRGLPLLGLLATGVAWAASDIVSFVGRPDPALLSSEETRLWHQSSEQDGALQKQGSLYEDAALDAYLQGLCDRLFPEFDGAIRMRALRSTLPNAFMMPNGSTYMHAGMLAVVRNEAQLAAIIAHEGGHFVDKHGLRNMRRASKSIVFAQLVALGGVPLVGELIAASSIYGFSRELEREADAAAVERMSRAGYDLGEASAPFLALQGYYAVNKIKEPIFYASHPRLDERIDYFDAAADARGTAGGARNDEAFLAATAGARLFVLEEELKRRNHAVVIHLLSDAGLRATYPREADYHLAAALRQRNAAGDLARAEELLVPLSLERPEHPETWKLLGDLRLRAGQGAEARVHYLRYLELRPDAADRAFVERQLQKLESGATP
jgi:predicted Zn-dependent protease